MTGVATRAAPPGASGGAIAHSRIGSGGAATADITSKQFVSTKRPGNDYERVACLAYYLTTHLNTPQFKTRDITELSKDARVHLTNRSQAVQHATNTYRYLMAAGGGKKQITNLGEAIVEALPDREAVKQAIAENRPRRRKRRKHRKPKE